jgi:hypothetical protein
MGRCPLNWTSLSRTQSITSGSIAGVQLGGINELISNNIPPIGTGRSEDTDQTIKQVLTDARTAAVLMDNIDADRIPCPRLCGATVHSDLESAGLLRFC